MSSELTTKAIDRVKCPGCTLYMLQDIYRCSSGHSTCEKCRKTREKCCMCNSYYTDLRNFALEAVVLLLKYPCPFTHRGCKEFHCLKDMSDHATICGFRSYPCRLGNGSDCDWTGGREDLEDHYLLEHHKYLRDGTDYEDQLCCTEPQDKTEMLVAFEEYFYMTTKFKDNAMHWIAQYIGRSEDINLYYFQLEVYCENEGRRKMIVTEICNDDVKNDVDELIDTGFCVSLPMKMLSSFKNPEGFVEYNIDIKKA